jgi:hypothetical protein
MMITLGVLQEGAGIANEILARSYKTTAHVLPIGPNVPLFQAPAPTIATQSIHSPNEACQFLRNILINGHDEAWHGLISGRHA